jgi:hypothetical protein
LERFVVTALMARLGMFEQRGQLVRSSRDGRRLAAWKWRQPLPLANPAVLGMLPYLLITSSSRSLFYVALSVSVTALSLSLLVTADTATQPIVRRKRMRLQLQKAGYGGLTRVCGQVRTAPGRDAGAVVLKERRVTVCMANLSLSGGVCEATVQESLDFDLVTRAGETVRVCSDGALLAARSPATRGPVLDPAFDDLLRALFKGPVLSVRVAPPVELIEGAWVEVFGMVAPSNEEEGRRELVAGADGLMIFPLAEPPSEAVQA